MADLDVEPLPEIAPPNGQKIDLHTHSCISDGTDSPYDLMRQARDNDVYAIALTDHDTSSGWNQARNAAEEYGVTFVPGMELSTQSADGVSLHILSYLHDPTEPTLLEKLEEQRAIRLRRARQIVNKLSFDYPLCWEDVVELGNTGKNAEEASFGRPHIADALTALGIVSGREEAFNTLLSSTSRYYVPLTALTPHEGIKLVVAAGGVPVLAHGLAQKHDRRPTEPDFKEWARIGLAGVEVHHRMHTAQDRIELLRIAKKYDLIVTGSSDFHGDGKPNRLGENFTPAQSLRRIEALGTGSKIFRPR